MESSQKPARESPAIRIPGCRVEAAVGKKSSAENSDRAGDSDAGRTVADTKKCVKENRAAHQSDTSCCHRHLRHFHSDEIIARQEQHGPTAQRCSSQPRGPKAQPLS